MYAATLDPGPAPFSSPETVPPGTLAAFRRYLAGHRFTDGRALVRTVFHLAHQFRGRQLTDEEARRARLAARALWREATPAPCGGRQFARRTA